MVEKATRKIGAIRDFTGEVAEELRKSSWPTGAELMESTLVVILSVIILTVFVGVCDMMLDSILKLLLR